MSTIKVKDGTEIYYKDWGTGQPLFFHHGWPLSGDDWDGQMMFFLKQGYRVIAHDRRGTRAVDPNFGVGMIWILMQQMWPPLPTALDLKGCYTHWPLYGWWRSYSLRWQRTCKGRVAKAGADKCSYPAIMVKTEQLTLKVSRCRYLMKYGKVPAFNRAQYFEDFTIPFYGYNREGAKSIAGHQGTTGGARE